MFCIHHVFSCFCVFLCCFALLLPKLEGMNEVSKISLPFLHLLWQCPLTTFHFGGKGFVVIRTPPLPSRYSSLSSLFSSLSSGSYLNSLCKEEVLGEVAAEGLEAALVVQQLLPHQGGHSRRAVDPKQVAEFSKTDSFLIFLFESSYLLRYIRAWKVPKNTFSRDEDSPAPSQISVTQTNYQKLAACQ